jgi:hypothetical protein
MKRHAIVRLRRVAARMREIMAKLTGVSPRAAAPMPAGRTARDA